DGATRRPRLAMTKSSLMLLISFPPDSEEVTTDRENSPRQEGRVRPDIKTSRAAVLRPVGWVKSP
ncbi:hypothetical protein, partial [Rhodopseudomonas palustris]|uniref:hypothetical protein n=1 Tax=Rhodopseudomonas palustris TaxID=1076 RepID=UPI001AEC3322